MMTSQKKFLLWLIIFVAITLIICTLTSLYFLESHEKAKEVDKQEAIDKLNQVLRSDSNCYAPCWQSLTPGISGQADYQRFATIISRQSYYLRSESQRLDGTTYTWANDESNLVIFISMVDNTLVYIDIAGLDAVDSNMLIDVLGPPSQYSAEWVRDIGSTVSTHFYYEDKGIYIKFNGVDPGRYVDDDCRLKTSLPLNTWRLNFVEPNSSYDMRANAFGEELVRGTVFREWDGLDNIIVSDCFR
jgi:hypothetical protein